MAGRIEAALMSPDCPSWRSPKFSIVLDGGGSLLDGISADIRVDLRIQAAGLAHISIGQKDGRFLALGACGAEDTPQVILRLVTMLTNRGDEGCDRMRDLSSGYGSETVRAPVEELLISSEPPPKAQSQVHRLVGFQTGWFGIGVPFGAGNTKQWEAIADIADRFGTGEIRIAPSRCVLVPGVATDDCAELSRMARDHQLITEDDEPLLQVVACPGSPACSAAYGETRTLATGLSNAIRPLLAGGATMHVSGCGKSCARSGSADITIVHDRDGCKIDFGTSVLQTLASSAAPISELYEQLARFAASKRL
jgi:precorrin-3B synthase